jgi:quinolinate synthase
VQGIVACLRDGSGEIDVPEPVRSQALGCIDRMLDFVRRHPHSVAPAQAGFVPHTGAA